MIYYGKLLKLFEENGITSYTIKNEKLRWKNSIFINYLFLLYGCLAYMCDKI